MVPRYLAMPLTGPSFYAHVFHPAFNLDPGETVETVERFDVHTQAVGKGVQGLRNVFGRIRDARVG
jgi:sorting nexin-9/18/33